MMSPPIEHIWLPAPRDSPRPDPVLQGGHQTWTGGRVWPLCPLCSVTVKTSKE